MPPPSPSTWTTLADPHRRAMLAHMLERPRAVNERVEHTGLSQPGTSKHLRVVARPDWSGSDRTPSGGCTAWTRRRWPSSTSLAPYRRLWNDSLDALERHLDHTREDEP